MAGFLRFNREADQYLFCYVLRPGNAPAKQGAIGILARVIERMRAAFPKARILARLDGRFSGPELLNFLEDEAKVDYIIGMAENKVLKRRARRRMGRARRLSKRRGKIANVFGETRYAAKSWKGRKRRVLIKAEVVRLEGREPKDNGRFVVTNLKGSPRHLYKKVYCYRGDIENRIKELHHGLEIDRTSCTNFKANQLRVLLMNNKARIPTGPEAASCRRLLPGAEGPPQCPDGHERPEGHEQDGEAAAVREQCRHVHADNRSPEQHDGCPNDCEPCEYTHGDHLRR